MKALWHIDANTTEWRSQPLSYDASKDYIHIKTNYSMISTGTERLVAIGAVPPSMYEQMTVPYMEGNFDFPIKYGYACGVPYLALRMSCLHSKSRLSAIWKLL